MDNAWKKGKEGVMFYQDKENLLCTDIEVPDGIEELTLSGFSGVRISKKNTKSFPNIKRLVISEEVQTIKISNLMFPNVRDVISKSQHFTSGHMLQASTSKNGLKILQNAFCLHPDEIIDLNGVCQIEELALCGCMTTNLINTEQVEVIQDNGFAGSAFEKIEPEAGHVLMAGSILIKASVSEDGKIDVPAETTAVDFTNIDFNKFDAVVLHNLNTLNRISKYGLSSTVIFAEDCEIPEYEFNGRSYFANTENIKVNAQNQYYKSINGILYSKDGERLIKCPGKKQGIVNIPEGVKRIKDTAFFHTGISEVILPTTLKEIGYMAFCGCGNLSKLTLYNGVEIIDEWAFASTSITDIRLPDSIKEIRTGAFLIAGLKKVCLPNPAVKLNNDSLSALAIYVENWKYLPSNFINAIAHLQILTVMLESDVVKIMQNNKITYIQKQVVWEKDFDTLKKEYLTIDDLIDFYNRHQVEILKSLLQDKREKDFAEAFMLSKSLLDSKTLRKVAIELLEFANNRKLSIAQAYILNTLKSDKLDFSI